MDDHTSTSMNRRLAAILAADIAGYSRLMGEDEPTTVRDLKGHQAVILPLVGRYGGRIIDTAGDGILAEFPSVINATECAVEMQTIMATRNEGVPESRRMLFRIGINLGDVIHDEARIYGDGINVETILLKKSRFLGKVDNDVSHADRRHAYLNFLQRARLGEEN